MPYQIDYIPVGDGERSGDAIALRFGNLSGPRSEQNVVIIDGGFKESGELLVKHIKAHYNTSHVDLVISTHPDADHTSGLLVVLEKLSVGQLAMHRPWEHASDIKNLFANRRVTVAGIENALEKSLQYANDLEELATKKGVQIVEPFQGITGFNGVIHVLGPSLEYYQKLLALFRQTPGPVNSLGHLAQVQGGSSGDDKIIPDHPTLDLLNNDDELTSAENNSSTVLLFNIDGHKILFTGDAGKTALLQAVNYAENRGIMLNDLRFFDVPHHGSKRNISSKILKKIRAENAFVSAAKDSPKHPAKKVTNGLLKHGTKVFVTRGASLLHHHNAPQRGWGPAEQEQFHTLVEE